MAVGYDISASNDSGAATGAKEFGDVFITNGVGGSAGGGSSVTSIIGIILGGGLAVWFFFFRKK